MDPENLYVSKFAYKIAILFVIIGALNWLSIGLFDTNVVQAIVGRGLVARFVYIFVGICALAIMFDRDTYLPFLGQTVMPCSILVDKTPADATAKVIVTAAPGSKVLFWAAEPALDSLKDVPTWDVAYSKYENIGVTTAGQDGVAVLRVRDPQPYRVPWKGELEPHVHYRICEGNGMLGKVRTVYTKDMKVEGFRGF
jgi:uncharacterized membrane protein YuzA (DUF378 family)